MVTLKLWHLVLFLSIVAIVSADKPKKRLSDEIATQLKAIQSLLNSKNSSPLARSANGTARDSTDFEQELENLFEQVLNGKWENAGVLLQFASLTPDASVKLIIYKVLWRQMQSTGMFRNPFATIKLYGELQANLANHITSLNAAEQQIFAQLQKDILDAIIERSAQILEGPFHASNTNCSCEFPVLEELVGAIQYSLGDEVFDKVFDMIYDNIAYLETPLQIAKTLATFPPNIIQNAVANLNYTKRVDFDAPGGQLVNAQLRDNFWNIKNRTKESFGCLSLNLQIKIDEFLGIDERVWRLPQVVCIRNATNDLYLYKTSNSTYIGTQPKSLNREIFSVEKHCYFYFRSLSVGNDKYITKGDYDSTIMPAVAKNVISGRGSEWVVLKATGNSVYILDNYRRYYLCAGSLDFYEDGNIYAYTRRSDTVQEYQNECQWIIEDCE